MRRLLLPLIAMFLVVPSARADDTYSVDSCSAGPGLPATAEGWTVWSTGPGPALLQVACPSPGVVITKPSGQVPRIGGSSARFTAPPNTRIAGYRLWRSTQVAYGWNYTLYRTPEPSGQEEHIVERCWSFALCNALGDADVSPPADVSETGVDQSAILLNLQCNYGPPDSACTGNEGSAVATLHRLQVDLADRIDPKLDSVPSGDLLDTSKPISGARSISFSASDVGGGVYTAWVTVDGQAVASSTVDDNGGRCVKPFRNLVPCKAAASGSLTVDTARLADGPHAVRLVVADATETNVVSYGPVQITTANRTAACDPGNATELTSRFASTRRTTMTRRGGRAVTLTGGLAGAGAGGSVLLLSREQRTGAPWVVAASAVTGAGGRFRVTVPPGPSRSLRVAYRANATAATLRCAGPLKVRVPARVSKFRAKRTGARRYRLSGRLLGGSVPQGGALIELQGFERGKWRRFDTVRSSSRGSFSTSYRFRMASRGRTFRLRARVRADKAYPFAVGYSRSVRVRVR